MSEVAPKSLVLVTVDCWRADHAGFMGYPAPTTPFLDRLAAESLVFPKAIVTGAPTYYSFPGLLASRFPLSLGREVVGLAPEEVTLAAVFQRAGYKTAAFVAANPYLSARFGYQQGFAAYRDFLIEEPAQSGDRQQTTRTPRARTRFNQQLAKFAHRLGPVGAWYDELYFQYCQRIAAPRSETWHSLRRFPTADVLVNEACTWLASLGPRSFFLWLHLMDPHAPYYPPPQAIEAMRTGRPQPARARYLNESWNRGDLGPDRLRKYRAEIVQLHDAGIRWVDMQLARLVEALRASSRWDSCVFALTADHGEEFLDHGGRFHPPSRAFQEMLRVPLLLRVPGVGKKTLSDAPFSHLHLAPTVLDAIGIEPPAEFEGRSYWREVQAGAGWELAVSESVGRCTNPMVPEKRFGGRVLAVQDRMHKLILDFERHAEELFDLDADPDEQRVLPEDAEKTIRIRLLRTALHHLERRGREPKTALALAARVRQFGLELSRSEMPSETPAT